MDNDIEKKYEALFKNMLNGFSLHRIVISTDGSPIDYEFIEVNKAFEDMTGLKRDNIIGKKVTEVIPGTENDPANWIQRYGKIALGGKDEKFEDFSAGLNKWFSICAYSPIPEYFATIFEDITVRKNTEISLIEKNEELEKINKIMMDRELRMIELKKEIAELKN